MPAAEVEVDVCLVERLILDQCPDFAGLEVSLLANGWDNVTFLVGEDHVARMPRREMAAGLIDNEARWLPGLAPLLPLPIPAPVFVGEPAEGYPWHWLIAPRIPGVSAATSDGLDLRTCAQQLGEFLEALHQTAPDTAPVNPYRGIPLAARDTATRERLDLLAGSVDADVLAGMWDKALDTPVHDGPGVWLHGDLHPHNLLVRDDVLSGVVDFGDITSGDPATDLAVAWMLLPSDLRDVFRESCGGVDDAIWIRAHGWALSFGLTYLAHSADNPVMHRIGERTIEAVLTSPS